MISVILETLRDGKMRATVRYDGRSVVWRDCLPEKAKETLDYVMRIGCFAHRVGDSYDFTHIQLNEAAAAVLNRPAWAGHQP